MSQKLTGRHNVESQTINVRNDTTMNSFNVVITDGDYFVIDDGAADDLITVVGQAIAFEDPELSTFGISLNQTTGIVTVSDGGSVGFTITWASAIAIRDILGFTGATTVIASGGSTAAATSHLFGFYPSCTAIDDIQDRTPETAHLVPDNDSVQGIWFGDQVNHTLTLAFDGGPRKLVSAEWEQMDDFMLRAMKGQTFRYYADVTVITAYVQVTNPDGFLQLVLDVVSATWAPRPRTGNFHGSFVQAMPSLRVP